MFVGLSEISASVVVLKCETCWNYQSNLISFSVPRGCKKLLGCGLLGGAVPSLTLWILILSPEKVFVQEWKRWIGLSVSSMQKEQSGNTFFSKFVKHFIKI